MGTSITVEALLASPPTDKCEETIRVLEELIRHHPDELRLTVFRRGIDFSPDNASTGMKILMRKSCPIPAVVINGNEFSRSKVPDLEGLEARVKEVIQRTRADH
jgi:hypothetical protein